MLCWKLERNRLLTLYHCGFCISFGSRWVVRIRQARRAATAPSRMACLGSHTATKMLSKKGCTCWKKKVGTLMASSRSTRTWEERHRETLHLDQRALFSQEHSLFSRQSQHSLGKLHTRPLLQLRIPGHLGRRAALMTHVRVHYRRVFTNRVLVRGSQDTQVLKGQWRLMFVCGSTGIDSRWNAGMQ